MTPLLKIDSDTSRKLNLLSFRVYCLKKVVECTIHEYFTFDIGCSVFFPSGVMTSTAGKSVLFVLRSRTKKASLAP